MNQRAENEELIIRYLTGDLSKRKRKQVEDRYFEDDVFFEEMTIVEDELVDDYVRGRLTGREREQFEKHFLTSPARRERVEFSRTMLKSLTNESISDEPFPVIPDPNKHDRRQPRSWFRSLFSGRNRTLQFAVGTAVLAITAGAAWLIIEHIRLINEINVLRAERAALERRERELTNQAAELTDQAAEQRERERELTEKFESEQNQRQQLEQQLALSQPQPLAIFSLTSNATRGGTAVKPLSIPSGTKMVVLKLYVESGDYSSYRAVLRNAEGGEILSRKGLKASTTSSGKIVTVNLPAELLSSRDYILTLGGKADGDYEDVGEYLFKVMKK